MTISAHLTPDPERRLKFLLETASHAAESTDKKIGALTLFAALEVALLSAAPPPGTCSCLPLVLLGTALPLGVLAFSPLTRIPRRWAFLDPAAGKPEEGDGLIDIENLAKHTRQGLTLTLDRYLGGGITSTPYFEDLIGQIISLARVTIRKRRLFAVSCVLVGIGQLALLGQIIYSIVG